MTTPCYHCALPVPAGSRFTAEILGERRELCCPGCQAVAEAIVAGGLESYYQHRSEASANPAGLPAARTRLKVEQYFRGQIDHVLGGNLVRASK